MFSEMGHKIGTMCDVGNPDHPTKQPPPALLC